MITKKGTILVVDDNRAIRTSLELLLPRYFERVLTISTPNQLPTTLRTNPNLDVVLLDMNFHAGINNGNEGRYWLREIKKLRPSLSVVLFTAYADIELAVAAIKEGAVDFVEKPWDNNKLIVSLQNAVDMARNSQKIKNLKSIKIQASDMFWGESDDMQSLRRIVRKAAPTDANILIMGENGTGKEVLAREIHKLSERADEPLVTVDMGAITENLFESELFGNAKGAFTDAKNDRAGKFEVADGGTLFLDEIGNLPLHLQAKLLSVIQSRTVIRLGEHTPRPVNIRLIAATNSDLQEMVANGSFREDLYYRLNTIVLNIPPLRQRGEDVMHLSNIFLAKYAKKYGKQCDSFSADALEKLRNHSWPGNIRELQHTIEKALIMADAKRITSDDLLVNKANATKNNITNHLAGTIEDMEREMIQVAMIDAQGNLSEVAARLGITRQTLYNKIKKFNL